MSRTLRILVLEDVPHDAELEIAALESAGYTCEWERVDNRDAFVELFERRDFDLVLSDYSLPSFDGLAAVRLVAGSPRDIPFILISGTLGEEAAVEALRAGVTDFVLKDRLPKLPLVVERALQERSERRRAREAERQIQLQAEALESAANAIVITDPSGSITFVNRAFTALTGYSPEDVLGHSLSLLKSGEHDEEFYGDLWTTVSSGRVWHGELINRRKDGSHYFEEQTITPVKNEGREITHYICVKQDITERKDAEAERRKAGDALRESEQRYRELVENAIDIIYTHDLNGNFLSVNRAAEKISGYSSDEILKMNFEELVAPDCIDKMHEMIAETLAGQNAIAYELEITAKDGRRITVEVNTRILRRNDVAVAVQGVARDVTERKLLEEQFRQAQKMEAVGLLAGGIAHDFNNLLTAITGYSSLTLRKLPKDDPLRRNLDEIKRAGERAAELTSQLLAFSRKQILKPSPLNLNKVILDIENLLRRITRDDVELIFDLEAGLGNISADRGQIEQVVINLAINARDAMPDGGRLKIKTENVGPDDSSLHSSVPVRQGPWVRLCVTDTGEGMDAATQKRIFEPFFTTKEVGKGTGLGLAMVHGTVKQSNGEVVVQSTVGRGTTFEIYLPRIDRNESDTRSGSADEGRYAGRETILLVEDEDTVRELVREFLVEFGYKVIDAPSGDDALRLFGDHRGSVDLLLTDVSMPGMSGPQLRNEILALDPDVNVLFMSGYADDILRKSDPDMKTPLIDKPFTPDALAKKIREILQE